MAFLANGKLDRMINHLTLRQIYTKGLQITSVCIKSHANRFLAFVTVTYCKLKISFVLFLSNKVFVSILVNNKLLVYYLNCN
jgi:hypothetical protein